VHREEEEGMERRRKGGKFLKLLMKGGRNDEKSFRWAECSRSHCKSAAAELS
jgi:hypothetical protein